MPPTRRRPHAALLGTVATTLLLGACGTAASPSGTASEPTGADPTAGGTVTVALDNPITCVDPHQATAFAAFTVLHHVVDQLTYQHPGTGDIEPWLATSWQVEDDARRFTFELRDDVTFSDGTALDAQVVVDNLQRVVDLGAQASLGSSYLAGVTGISAVDEGTVLVEFAEPNAQFLQATTTAALGVLAPATLDADPADTCDGGIVGSGPFTLASYTADEGAVIERRDGYAWAPASAEHQGDALLDAVDFRIVPESGVRTGLLTSGQADVVAGVFREDEPQLQDTDAYWLVARATPGLTNSFVVNTSRPLLADADVRRALQVAIDRAQVAEVVQSSLSLPATGLLSSSAPFRSDRSADLAVDVDGANALLDDAGWAPGPDGVRVKDGQRLSLSVVHFAAQSPVVELLNQQLHAVGAELVPQVLDPAQRDAVEQAGDFDLLQRNLTRADPDVLRNQLAVAYSNYLYKDAPDALDDLLDAQAATTDTAERQRIVDEIQDRLLDDALVWPVNELTQVYAGTSAVHGVTLDASSRPVLTGAWKE